MSWPILRAQSQFQMYWLNLALVMQCHCEATNVSKCADLVPHKKTNAANLCSILSTRLCILWMQHESFPEKNIWTTSALCVLTLLYMKSLMRSELILTNARSLKNAA